MIGAGGITLTEEKCVTYEQSRIFIVEDNPGVCEAISVSLQDLGYKISGWCSTAEQALEVIPGLSPDLVIMDINLAGEMDGVEAATHINEELFIPVVFLTGNDDDALTPRIAASGSYGYLVKPYNQRELKLTIEIALSKHQMEAQLRQSEEFYHTLAEVCKDGIILIDNSQDIRYLNAEVRRIVRMISEDDPGEPVDSHEYQICPGIFHEQIMQIIGTVSASGKPANKISAFSSSDHEYWLEFHAFPVLNKIGYSRAIMVIVRDVTLQVEFDMEVRKAGLSRIEENMEKFQILNDQIRNPLQVLTGLVDIEGSPLKSRYLEQIHIINQVIRDFDESWVRSEKVRKFLLTHYGHGLFLKSKDLLKHRDEDDNSHHNHHYPDHYSERTLLFIPPGIDLLRGYSEEDKEEYRKQGDHDNNII